MAGTTAYVWQLCLKSLKWAGGQGATRYLAGTDGRYLKIVGHSRHSHMLARPLLRRTNGYSRL